MKTVGAVFPAVRKGRPWISASIRILLRRRRVSPSAPQYRPDAWAGQLPTHRVPPVEEGGGRQKVSAPSSANSRGVDHRILDLASPAGVPPRPRAVLRSVKPQDAKGLKIRGRGAVIMDHAGCRPGRCHTPCRLPSNELLRPRCRPAAKKCGCRHHVSSHQPGIFSFPVEEVGQESHHRSGANPTGSCGSSR